MVYGKLGQFQKAFADCNKAIALSSRLANHQRECLARRSEYGDRGVVYLLQKQYQKAIDDDSKSISIDPKYVDAYVNRAAVYGKLGQFQKAIDDLDKAIGINSMDGELYARRAGANYALGKKDLADKDVEKAKQLGFTPDKE
jgi:tetratricopeptide (TPR) repeat protein